VGLSIVWRYLHQDFAIHMLAPPHYDVTRVTIAGYRAAADLVTTLKSDRPALLVAGFFGRGNCGDEALLQAIYERLSADFEIVVSLDEHGAFPEYWNWYPYDRTRRIHQGNLSDPARSCSGMIVGGGGLPIGFVADQVFAARSAGLPVALAGTDFPIINRQSPFAERVSVDYLKSFDLVALRSATAVERAREAGVAAVHGADWALSLPTDESDAFQQLANRVLIVLREFPLEAVSFRYVEEITRLIGQLRAAGFAPTLLPFCPEDDRFATALGLDLLVPTERHWWNPRRVKQLIALSGLLISVGRLHPMIFAATTRTPVIQLCPPLADNMDPHAFGKISAMTKELDVDYLPSVDAVCEHVRLGRSRPSGQAALEVSQQRLEDMIDRLRRLFSPKREAAAQAT
jgi:polysaccharide pyruvyl transferase WcaK-like protein